MVDFLSSPIPNGLKQRIIKPAHRTISSSGHMMARPKGTVKKNEFSVMFKFLSKSERDNIQSFFDSYQGTAFNFTHPELNGQTYSVTFAEDELSFDWVPPDYYSTTVVLREL